MPVRLRAGVDEQAALASLRECAAPAGHKNPSRYGPTGDTVKPAAGSMISAGTEISASAPKVVENALKRGPGRC
jgi:hypothetical protein